MICPLCETSITRIKRVLIEEVSQYHPVSEDGKVDLHTAQDTTSKEYDGGSLGVEYFCTKCGHNLTDRFEENG